MLLTALKRLGIGALVLTAALIFLPAGQASADQVITGAGSTFVYPILSKWAQVYNKETGVQLNYQSIGSGGGIAQIKAATVNFGASDAPLTEKVLNKAGLMQWPVIMGGVVPVLNVPGIRAGEVRLSGKVLGDIYLGKVKYWDDAEIHALNRHVKLPHRAITVVHRSDGSGTSWIFTNYLSKVNSTWKDQIGFATSVAWPAGVGGKGNEGVAAYVQRIKGSIGYVEFAYALQNHMTYVLLRNRAGHYVHPTIKSFSAAAANADWNHAPGFYLVLTDQPGRASWPITGATFILFYKNQKEPDTGKAVLKFLDWGYHHGVKMAEKLDYVPIPRNVVKLIESKWVADIHGNDGSAVWNSAAMASR